jgi:hypothetical protein
MLSKWVTIATFNMPYQAHLAKSRLEAADIPVTIRDEHLISINQLYSPALGGVKVLVPGANLKEAQEILNSVPEVELQDEEALSATMPEEPGPRPPEAIECPHCGSEGFAEELHYPIERFLNGLLLGLPYLWIGRPLHCRACRHTFRAQ